MAELEKSMALRYLAFRAGVTIRSVERGSWNAERGKDLLSRMFEELKDEQRYMEGTMKE